MQSDQDKTIHMQLEGTLAKLLVQCDPSSHSPYLTTEKENPILYVEALYGTLRVALLFWRKLTKKLVEWVFEVNPYDWCITNKMLHGKQCTITWHMDNLKILHMEKTVLDELHNWTMNLVHMDHSTSWDEAQLSWNVVGFFIGW